MFTIAFTHPDHSIPPLHLAAGPAIPPPSPEMRVSVRDFVAEHPVADHLVRFFVPNYRTLGAVDPGTWALILSILQTLGPMFLQLLQKWLNPTPAPTPTPTPSA